MTAHAATDFAAVLNAPDRAAMAACTACATLSPDAPMASLTSALPAPVVADSAWKDPLLRYCATSTASFIWEGVWSGSTNQCAACACRGS